MKETRSPTSPSLPSMSGTGTRGWSEGFEKGDWIGPVEIQNLPGREGGRGMIATRDIKAGEVLLGQSIVPCLSFVSLELESDRSFCIAKQSRKPSSGLQEITLGRELESVVTISPSTPNSRLAALASFRASSIASVTTRLPFLSSKRSTEVLLILLLVVSPGAPSSLVLSTQTRMLRL